MTTPARTARLGAVLALVAVTMVLAGTPAAAHVLLAKAQPNGNGTTTLTFTFDHGCGTAPTTELAVSLPTGVTAVTTEPTTQPHGWSAQTTTGQVKWTGPGVTPGQHQAEFAVVTRIVGTVGQTFQFPTVQRCDNNASYAWTDPQPGDEHPAPTMIATRAVLAEQPPSAIPATTTRSETGASLAVTLSAIAIFAAAAATLGRFVTRPKPPDATP
jgi:uncharacterized protein YcnI